MKPADPEKEHLWLKQLVGEWRFEFEVPMKPGEPPVTLSGTETVRAIGDLWVVGEGHGQMPDGTPSHTVLTLGYDPQKKKFVGTWLGSMMTFLWVYEGELDAARTSLALDTEGPSFDSETGGIGAKFAKYREVIELGADGVRHFTSSVLGADGQWQRMMRMEYRRVS